MELVKHIDREILHGRILYKGHSWIVHYGTEGPFIHWRGDPRNGNPTD
jgi:hypothetical protein